MKTKTDIKLELTQFKGREAKVKHALTDEQYTTLKQLSVQVPLVKQVTDRVLDLVGVDLPHPDSESTYFSKAITHGLTEIKECKEGRDSQCRLFIEACVDALMTLPYIHVWITNGNFGTRVWDFSCEDFTVFQEDRAEVHLQHTEVDDNVAYRASDIVRQCIRGRLITRNLLVAYGIPPTGQSRRFTFKELEHANAG